MRTEKLTLVTKIEFQGLWRQFSFLFECYYISGWFFRHCYILRIWVNILLQNLGNRSKETHRDPGNWGNWRSIQGFFLVSRSLTPLHPGRKALLEDYPCTQKKKTYLLQTIPIYLYKILTYKFKSKQMSNIMLS